MKKMKFNYFMFVMMGIGLIGMLYLIKRNSDFSESLIKIDKDKSYDIQVENAYNERGAYILNNKYFIASATSIIGSDYGHSNDKAIWRPKNAKFIPTISNISAPFRIHKEIDNDTVKIDKGNKTILLLMSDD